MRESNQEFKNSQPEKRKSILVVQTAFLGDLLLGIPFFKKIKTPENHVTLFCRTGLGQLMLDFALIDAFVEVSKTDPKEMSHKWSQLRQKRWSAVYCIHESPRSHYGVWSLRADHKVGYKKWYGRLIFNQMIERSMHLPEALRQLALLKTNKEHQAWVDSAAKGFSKHPQQDKGVTLLPEVPSQLEMHIPELRGLQLARRAHWSLPLKIAVAPGSTWLTKRWPHFAEFIENFGELWKAPVEFSLVGSPQEQILCNDIIKKLEPSTRAQVRIFSGPLMQVARHYAESDLLLSNDSGAQHLGALSGVPTVSLFGPTTLDLGYRPWNSEALVVENIELDCRPCGRHGSDRCPLGHHRCMQELSVAKVIQGCVRLLQKINPERFREH